MQSLLVYILTIPILLVLILIIDLLLDVYFMNSQSRLIKYFKSKKEQIFWNAVVSFYFSNYLVLSMIGFISIRDIRLDS